MLMAWPSLPLTFVCRACGWKHTTPEPVGDCRIPGLDHFDTCPRCAGEVVSRQANPAEIAAMQLAQLARILKQR